MTTAETHIMIVETNSEEDKTPVILLPTSAWLYVGLHTREELAAMREADALPEGAPTFGPEDNMLAVGLNNVDAETAVMVLRGVIEVLEAEVQE